MSKCYNCGKEFTLGKEEIRCDNCRKVTNFPCHNCHEWFSIADENGKKRKECAYCGFFICPNCNTCGYDCEKVNHIQEVINIIKPTEIEKDKVNKIVEYFGEIKLNRDRRVCDRGVPISYAKSRIKSCFVRIKGFRARDMVDLQKFKERFQEVTDIDLGKQLTINQSREAGSYGQEYRDVFNLCVCLGKLDAKKVKKKINNEEIEYEVWERCEKEGCMFFDAKDLITKKCPCKTCTIKSYPINEEYCIRPECKYQKGEKKGQLRKLELSISNKDICQLKRGEFKVGKDKP